MFKTLLLLVLLTFTLQADLLKTDLLNDKIKNLIGQEDFTKHNNLINFIFKNRSNFIISDTLNYTQIVKKLQENGLLKLAFDKPKDITVTFQVNKDPVKSLKILKDTLKSLGYYYYFTKSTRFDGQDRLLWSIKLTTEAAIDPLVLSYELLKQNARILEITKEENDTWVYKINTTDSILNESIFILNNEKIVLKKPLTPYILKVKKAKKIYITSRILNRWSPYVVFYDKHLNILEVIKKDKIYRKIKLSIPNNTKYIKISDLFTLINIKRGLSVVIKD